VILIEKGLVLAKKSGADGKARRECGVGKKGDVMTTRFDTDALVTDLQNVVRDSEQLLEAVSGATGEKAEALREKLAETLEAARSTCRDLEKRTKESLKVADVAIREHPYQSIAIALAAGIAVGAILAKK
jgi:ElaB/YqjD/DUF883 family membrane-anchored ribosome-binding protein